MKRKLKDIEELVKIKLSMHEALSSIPELKQTTDDDTVRMESHKEKREHETTLFEDHKRIFPELMKNSTEQIQVIY